jgi:hypothetical protein
LASDYSKFYLNDGTFIGVGAMNTIYDGTLQIRANVFIDTNGQKPPNLMGKDVFHFLYNIYWEGDPGKTGKLTAFGSSNRDDNINSTSNAACNNTGGSGYYCTKVIMQDSWQIKDDYPWN